MFWFTIISISLIVCVTLYACCVASSNADEKERKYWAEKHQKEIPH